jgi:hypothetical protein
MKREIIDAGGDWERSAVSRRDDDLKLSFGRKAKEDEGLHVMAGSTLDVRQEGRNDEMKMRL